MRRNYYLDLITRYLKTHPVVAILGPRQCGKTTLVQDYSDIHETFERENYFDLEDPVDIQRLQNPKLSLEALTGLVTIDEVQKKPDLFPLLRVLVDRKNNPCQYLILGSASRDLLQQSSETLAGRIAFIELTPFSSRETEEFRDLWLRGGFPRSYLAKSLSESFEWREFYITTYLEQDIPNLGIQIPANTLRRFWSMLTHYHGNIFNASELGRSFGVSDVTIRRYLDILTGTFMIRQLLPWQENLKKRQVKSPKIYFRDSGILHALLNIHTSNDLQFHPKLGASWEGFALEEVIRATKAKAHNCYFWATHSGAELDLLIFENGKRIGFEFKYCDAPKMTKSMQISYSDLSLDKLYVIYPGTISYLLAENIEVRGLENFCLGQE